MSFTLRSILLATVLYSTGAAATEFSFITGNPADAFGNSYSQTLDGLTTTATAWSTTGSENRYETAELEIFSGLGMGVCNRDEKLSCSSANNMHALDNRKSVDVILFSFSKSVRLSSLAVLQVLKDSDLSLWAGVGNQNLANLMPSSLGRESFSDSDIEYMEFKTVDLSAFTNSYDWLAVSARLSQTNDFAMLRSLQVQAVSTPVPEANTWAMLLAGVGLIGFAVHRRGGLASRRNV